MTSPVSAIFISVSSLSYLDLKVFERPQPEAVRSWNGVRLQVVSLRSEQLAQVWR